MSFNTKLISEKDIERKMVEVLLLENETRLIREKNLP